MTPAISQVVAAPAAAGQHWSICSLYVGTGSDPQHLDYTSRIACGSENSRWSERPGLDFPRWGKAMPTPCGDGCVSVPNDDPYGAITLLGIANDGALLAIAEDRFGAKGQATRTGLYRLPAGASQWQKGGALPSTYASYAPRPGGGLMWTLPLGLGAAGASGPLFTASYAGLTASPLPTPRRTPAATGNVDLATPLSWQPIANPPGFQPQVSDTNALAIAPSDGRTAYACSQPSHSPSATQARAWVTCDAGASWTALALPAAKGWCALVVDMGNPRDLLLDISNNSPGGLADTYYRSTDGGASWQPLRGLDGSHILQFATYGNTIYALRSTTPDSPKTPAQLQASGDGMATWRDIEGDIRGAGMNVGQFWLNPYNGVLLATNTGALAPFAPSNDAAAAMVWRSSDGGAHWRNLQAPGLTSVVVQPPQPSHVWGICLANDPSGGNMLVCGDDSKQPGPAQHACARAGREREGAHLHRAHQRRRGAGDHPGAERQRPDHLCRVPPATWREPLAADWRDA